MHYVRDRLEISDSVLSKHLSALAEAGYVEVARVRANSRSRRQKALTKPGRVALQGHLAALQEIVAAAKFDTPDEPTDTRAGNPRSRDSTRLNTRTTQAAKSV